MAKKSIELPIESLDRDLQWLEFNRRVLYEALDARTPLLERVKFLGIFTSNLDEFFMKRVGLYAKRIAFEEKGGNIHGQDPRANLQLIHDRVMEMNEIQHKCFNEMLIPELQKEGIYLLKWEDLTEKQIQSASEYFMNQVFPVLTPLAIDPGHPFPFISNLSLSLAVMVGYPGREGKLFSRLKVPQSLNQLVRLNRDEATTEYHFVKLVDIIVHNLDHLYPHMEVGKVMNFRVTRDSYLEWHEEGADDLLETLSTNLRQRRFGDVVRLECESSGDDWIKELLIEALDINETCVYNINGCLDYGDMKIIGDLNIPKLKFKPWQPMAPPILTEEGGGIFQTIRSGEFLVHHPYESFNGSVERFVREAVEDPRVQAIKMTLYRTGDNTPFIPLLIQAAEMGKQVVCLVELKARFDEERNIFWARKLEKAGVHVVYGLIGYKTHSKLTLVVRQENEGLKCYVHIGTGNYNAVTANVYEDYGYFTCDPEITGEVVGLFNYLTGRSLKKDYQKLFIAPVNMKEKFVELIYQEVKNAKQGKPARIIARCNALDDPNIMKALYDASQGGVKITLFVRGFCCLRPGIKGISENIEVRSIIGRFLEHSRIFYFQDGQEDSIDGKFYIGSADWMRRNLNDRVELACPIHKKNLREILWENLMINLDDDRQAWIMNSDGSYTQRKPVDGESFSTHQRLMKITKKKFRLK